MAGVKRKYSEIILRVVVVCRNADGGSIIGVKSFNKQWIMLRINLSNIEHAYFVIGGVTR